MRRCIVSPGAEQDIESILRWTDEHFGERARLRYEAVLAEAIADLAKDPERPGSQQRPEIAPGARTYHLWHSRKQVAASRGRIRQPRHLILFRVRGDGDVEISRVLHDSMDLATQLPPEYLD